MTRTNGVQHSGGHARRAALSQTVGVKEKKALGMSERAKYVRELFVSGTGARRRGQQISADLVQVREKSASMNGSVMRQQDSARSGFVTTSSAEASLLIWSRQECRSEETQFQITTPAICGPPQKSCGTVRPGQGSHNTGGTECLLLGNRTGISLGLIRDVSSDGVRPVLPETPA